MDNTDVVKAVVDLVEDAMEVFENMLEFVAYKACKFVAHSVEARRIQILSSSSP